MTMTLSAFPYPGGKTLLTDWIVEQIPDHHVYVEPFGGSGLTNSRAWSFQRVG